MNNLVRGARIVLVPQKVTEKGCIAKRRREDIYTGEIKKKLNQTHPVN